MCDECVGKLYFESSALYRLYPIIFLLYIQVYSDETNYFFNLLRYILGSLPMIVNESKSLEFKQLSAAT